MSRACTVCGRDCRISHHITGDALDGEFETPVCHDHHQLVHDDWHTLGVGAEQQPRNFFDRLVLRLRRTAAFLGRLVAIGVGGPLLRMLAEVLGRWAADLHMRVAILDARYEDWRSLPGMDE